MLWDIYINFNMGKVMKFLFLALAVCVAVFIYLEYIKTDAEKMQDKAKAAVASAVSAVGAAQTAETAAVDAVVAADTTAVTAGVDADIAVEAAQTGEISQAEAAKKIEDARLAEEAAEEARLASEEAERETARKVEEAAVAAEEKRIADINLAIEKERIEKSKWIYCGKGNDTCNKVGKLKYGIDSRWVYKTTTKPEVCSSSNFGKDPAPNVHKNCYYRIDTPFPLEKNSRCGPSYNNQRCSGTRYCSMWNWCGSSEAHKRNALPEFSGINTHFYI